MCAMIALGWCARSPAVLLPAVALWGAAFGGAPALLQTALIDASGPGHADMATSMQTTVYNIGIAAGSLAGGLILQRADAGALPWTASALIAAALAAVAVTRRQAFPADRAGAGTGYRHVPGRPNGGDASGRPLFDQEAMPVRSRYQGGGDVSVQDHEVIAGQGRAAARERGGGCVE